MPTKGVFLTKDLMKRFDYTKVKDIYEFYISFGELEVFENYIKVKYQKTNNECIKMTYNQFINYLYTEGYIDEKPKTTKHK
jgi:hypothetical protein